MTAVRMLPTLLAWEMRVQARAGIYVFTAITTFAFATILALLPDAAPDTVVTAILFLDPAVVGTGFVAAAILMDRSQNTLAALAVSPARPADYVAAKMITLTLLTVAGGLVLAAVAYWPPSSARAARFAAALTLTGAFGVAIGVVLVATARSMNHFIARAFPLSLVLYLSFLPHFGVVDGPWTWIGFGWNPGYPMLLSLLWAADPAQVTPGEAVYAFVVLTIMTAALAAWSVRLVATSAARGTE